LFHDPPHEELPIVDVPVLTQPETAPPSLLVQLRDADLTARSRERISPILDQSVLAMSVIRENTGIDPSAQIDIAREIIDRPAHFWPRLHWSGYPDYGQLEFACSLIWRLRPTTQARGGVLSAKQLAFKIRRFSTNPLIPDLIRSELEERSAPSPDEAVETVLDFLRQWAGFEFPRLLMALHRIQRHVFTELKRPPGNYEVFAARVEGMFMPTLTRSPSLAHFV